MQITLPPEIEALAQQAAKAGGYADVAGFVVAAVRQSALSNTVEQEQKISDRTPAYKLPYSEWKKQFQLLLDLAEPGNSDVDDRRESIYGERFSQLNP